MKSITTLFSTVSAVSRRVSAVSRCFGPAFMATVLPGRRAMATSEKVSISCILSSGTSVCSRIRTMRGPATIEEIAPGALRAISTMSDSGAKSFLLPRYSLNAAHASESYRSASGEPESSRWR